METMRSNVKIIYPGVNLAVSHYVFLPRGALGVMFIKFAFLNRNMTPFSKLYSVRVKS